MKDIVELVAGLEVEKSAIIVNCQLGALLALGSLLSSRETDLEIPWDQVEEGVPDLSF